MATITEIIALITKNWALLSPKDRAFITKKLLHKTEKNVVLSGQISIEDILSKSNCEEDLINE